MRPCRRFPCVAANISMFPYLISIYNCLTGTVALVEFDLVSLGRTDVLLLQHSAELVLQNLLSYAEDLTSTEARIHVRDLNDKTLSG